MYIRKIEITNIKGIEHFTMDFSDVSKPGWHVLIGDNGSGKTTILRCLGLALMPEKESLAFGFTGLFGKSETSKNKYTGYIQIHGGGNDAGRLDDLLVTWEIDATGLMWWYLPEVVFAGNDSIQEDNQIFSCGYGPFRRLSGSERDSLLSTGKRSLFRTLFSDEEGLGHVEKWLQGIVLDLSSKPEKQNELDFVINFINISQLLPDGATLTNKIDSQGIKIKDAAGNEVYFREASDGYRSILSLTLDLIKNMIAHYGIEKVMENSTATQIKLPGVVLIDEVDAHLHPNWQVRIGKWFTDFFPEIQFIVTTHSPLICRGSVNGQIWHLKTPGSGEESGPVSELQRKRLVYGDVLDAYGTEVFGQNITRSNNAISLRARMNVLQMKSIEGTISEQESAELRELKSFL